MKRIILATTSLFFLVSIGLFAQNDGDAIRMSQYFQTGTARAAAMGGAFNALGGDLTAVSINPAGLGIYRKSEFQITPLVYYDKTNSDYFSQSYEDFKYKFRIGSMGFVSAMSSSREKGWVSAAFALSYNRLADFNRVSSIYANNTSSSLLDEFTYFSEGLEPNELDGNYEGLAYDVNLISEGTIDGVTQYSHDMNYFDFDNSQWVSGYGQSQQKTILTKGGIDEYSAAFGANLSNVLYLGMSMGFNRLYYDESSVHTETDVNGDIFNLRSFDFNSYYTTRGSGFAMKFGAILRPADMLRIGASLHMPTFYRLTSDFSTSMSSSFEDGAFPQNSYFSSSNITTVDYDVITPWRSNLGLGLLLGTGGLISVDYERVDYTASRIKGDLTRYDEENKNIQDFYKAGNNLRLGGEVKLGIAALRAGYAIYGSPYKSGEINEKARTSILSAGFGVKTGGFYFDLAYSLASRPFNHVMYYSAWEDVPQDKIAALDQKTTRVMATFGFKF